MRETPSRRETDGRSDRRVGEGGLVLFVLLLRAALGEMTMGMRLPWQQADYAQTFLFPFIYLIFHWRTKCAHVDTRACESIVAWL